MQQEWDVPTFVDKEPNMAAIGEQWRGVGEGSQNLVYLDFGTGIGAGIIIDGKLYHGSRYGAGEIGFMGVGLESLGRKHIARGDLEEVASFDAIQSQVAVVIGTGKLSPEQMTGLGNEDPESLAAVLHTGRDSHGAAKDVLRRAGRIMGLAIANACSVLDPEMVIIGGDSIMVAPSLILESILEAAGALLLAPPKIVVSTLGKKAPILGAIRVVSDHANYALASNKVMTGKRLGMHRRDVMRRRTVRTD